ncbi:MAG: bifunctional hydroxymethylpyrimidine kinase/phosphomethylpyrimidine kinase, partial [Planctomycetes bacterium]|nr:bifunctional hydroxymethylpyrimidine kinase/phosphomethylpyrimidine kinase [Planctomycetota bacterium]
MEKTDRKSATSSESVQLLVIAGRDSSGGAGVDADLEAARWASADAAVVVTAETLQGEGGLVELGARSPKQWRGEADLALKGGVDAIKFGLLPGEEHVEAAAALVQELREGSADVPV